MQHGQPSCLFHLSHKPHARTPTQTSTSLHRWCVTLSQSDRLIGLFQLLFALMGDPQPRTRGTQPGHHSQHPHSAHGHSHRNTNEQAKRGIHRAKRPVKTDATRRGQRAQNQQRDTSCGDHSSHIERSAGMLNLKRFRDGLIPWVQTPTLAIRSTFRAIFRLVCSSSSI